jgi:hypothetical protein
VWDEESGLLHRKLEGFGAFCTVTALASFLSPDGRQARLVVGLEDGELRVYDPEAGSTLHRLRAHTNYVSALACVASSSAAPHHPRLVSASTDGTAKVWDGETGEMLADLLGHVSMVKSGAVWTEHTGGHDRIVTAAGEGVVKVYDGEALTLLRDLDVGWSSRRIIPFESAEGPTRLIVVPTWHIDGRGIQIWDPREGLSTGRLLQNGINRDCPLEHVHLFESAQGRHLLAISGRGEEQLGHPGDTDTMRAFIDVWDLGNRRPRLGQTRCGGRTSMADARGDGGFVDGHRTLGRQTSQELSGGGSLGGTQTASHVGGYLSHCSGGSI